MLKVIEKSNRLLRIGDLARLTGKTVRALHYYEELGLLHPVGHTQGGFRLYNAEAVARVQAIEKFQEIGMSLSDIKELSKIWEKSSTGKEASGKARDILINKLKETEEMIRRLLATKEELLSSLAVLDFCEPCKVKPDGNVCQVCGSQRWHEREGVLVEAFCPSHKAPA